MADILYSFICQRAILNRYHGTEFTSKAMFFWSKTKGVRLSFIQPSEPTQNAFVESLNGKFRNECLNQHWFRTFDEALYDIEQWQRHYNEERPHISLNYLPPAEYAKQVALKTKSH